MNKGELIELVAGELESSKADATKAVEAVMQAIQEGVKTKDKVTITGFGTFQKKHRAERQGINPATKQPMTIAASTTCAFKPATAFKEAI
ncbi:MAG: HU family DNA-binding protein [Planctomycetota bacterium]